MPQPDEAAYLEQILKDLKKIKYGSIEIMVHDGAIVQIEKKEKIRIENKADRLRV